MFGEEHSCGSEPDWLVYITSSSHRMSSSTHTTRWTDCSELNNKLQVNETSYLQPAVGSLQQVPQLQILEVRLKSQVVLGGVGHHGPADALRQAKTGVAAPTASVVVRCARSTGCSFADGAGWRQLARAVFILTAASVKLLWELTKLVVLWAVQEWLEVAQPVGLGPAPGVKNTGKTLIIQQVNQRQWKTFTTCWYIYCIKYIVK